MTFSVQLGDRRLHDVYHQEFVHGVKWKRLGEPLMWVGPRREVGVFVVDPKKNADVKRAEKLLDMVNCELGAPAGSDEWRGRDERSGMGKNGREGSLGEPEQENKEGRQESIKKEAGDMELKRNDHDGRDKGSDHEPCISREERAVSCVKQNAAERRVSYGEVEFGLKKRRLDQNGLTVYEQGKNGTAALEEKKGEKGQQEHSWTDISRTEKIQTDQTLSQGNTLGPDKTLGSDNTLGPHNNTLSPENSHTHLLPPTSSVSVPARAFVALLPTRAVGIVVTEPLAPHQAKWMVHRTQTVVPRPSGACVGISRIWVAPEWRRRGVARALLRAVACHSVYGMQLMPRQIAFSQPSHAGGCLAREFNGVRHKSGEILVLVYEEQV